MCRIALIIDTFSFCSFDNLKRGSPKNKNSEKLKLKYSHKNWNQKKKNTKFSLENTFLEVQKKFHVFVVDELLTQNLLSQYNKVLLKVEGTILLLSLSRMVNLVRGPMKQKLLLNLVSLSHSKLHIFHFLGIPKKVQCLLEVLFQKSKLK